MRVAVGCERPLRVTTYVVVYVVFCVSIQRRHSIFVRPRPLAGAYIRNPRATIGAHTRTRTLSQRSARHATALRLHRPVRATLADACASPPQQCKRRPKLLEGTRSSALLGVRSRVGEPGAILRAGRVCHRRTDRRVRRRVGGRSSCARMRVTRHHEEHGPGRIWAGTYL